MQSVARSFSLSALVAVPLLAVACGGSSSDGGTNTLPVDLSQVGAGGAGSSTCTPAACTPVTPTNALITDFEDVGPGGLFVDNDHFSNPNPNWWLEFYGTPYVFPQSASGLGYTAQGDWHVQGTVADWSGFGLWMGACSVDMSAYRGVSFEIWGNAGATGTIKLFALTDPDSQPEQCRTNVGSCDPSTETCATPFVEIPVAADRGTPVTVAWSDFAGGSPSATPDPSRMIQFMWLFDWYDWAGKKSTPYAVDVHVDDVRLVQ